MQHVSVCLTSISSRAEKLHITLRSLAAQNYRSFSVRIYVSREPYLLDQGDFRISQDCRDLMRANDNVSFVFVPNTGPYRKIIPFLQERIGDNHLVATADDDTVYPADWLSTLVQNYNERRCVVAFRGHQMLPGEGRWQRYRRWMTSGVTDNFGPYGLPTGKDGVLYNTMFFNRHVLNMDKAMAVAPTVDDLWLKWHSAFSGIPVFLINKNYSSATFEDTNDGTSLYQSFNKTGGNDVAIQALEEYSIATFGQTLLERAAK